jgi:hypothetical protein
MLRQINAIQAPKSTELHAHGNDGMAGATPPFDARCVTGFVRSSRPRRYFAPTRIAGLRRATPRTCQTKCLTF